MERLRARYSFTDVQCKKIVLDAHKLVTDAMQKLVEDIVPVIVDNIAHGLVTLLEEKKVVGNNDILVEDTILEDDSFDLAMDGSSN